MTVDPMNYLMEGNPDLCIGCGSHAHFYHENSISLIEKERIVRILSSRPN